MILEYKELNNKVYLQGIVINSVRQAYNMKTKEQYIYFVLGVKRENSHNIFNEEEYNYFYCYISEIVMGGTFLDKFKNEIKMYDNIEIKGMLDNKPYKQSNKAEVNYRALNSYTSTICVIDYTKLKKQKNYNDENLLINQLRKQFGKNTIIKIEKNADKIDEYGFSDSELPDF